MKKLFITICLVFALSSTASACEDCEYFWKEYYSHKKAEQKERFSYLKSEQTIQFKLSERAVKHWQKIRRRYRSSYRYYYRP